MMTGSNAENYVSTPGQTERAIVTACVDAVSLWRELKRGDTRIVALDLTEHYLIARLSDSVRASSPSFQSWRVLECMLMGESQKCIGCRLGLSPSTVSLHARTALDAFGTKCSPHRAPLFLFILFHAANRSMQFRDAHVTTLDEDGCRERLACLPRPDRVLDELLTGAEAEVARLRLMGATSALIALERRTSCRTVANQLASTYRKLGVSGRTELICKVLANLSDAPRQASRDLATHLGLLRSNSSFD